MKLNIVCKLCNRELDSFRALGVHLHYSHKDTSKQEYYDKFLKTSENEGVCVKCGKQCNLISLAKGYHSFCSVKCQTNDSTINEKRTKSKFEHFGDGNYFSKEGRESISKHQSKIANERMIEIIKKLKTKYKIPDEIEITNMSQIQEIKDKVSNTNIKKYGCKTNLHGSGFTKDDYEQTMLKRYGVKYPLQSHEIRKKAKKKFVYNGIEFDSKWEIAYYIWLTDNNIDFEYQPKSLKYDYKGEQKTYHPDFKIGEQLVEIKNSYLLKNMLENVDDSEHYKYMCMIENNVKIITDCKKYINYVNETYGKQLLKNVKKVNRSGRKN
jgi:hypothetical protein